VAVPQTVETVPQGVDLVYVYYASIFALSGFPEKLSDSLGSHPCEQLLELRCCHFDELALSLIRKSPGQHGLASSWGTVEEDSSSDSGSKFFESLRVVEK